MLSVGEFEKYSQHWVTDIGFLVTPLRCWTSKCDEDSLPRPFGCVISIEHMMREQTMDSSICYCCYDDCSLMCYVFMLLYMCSSAVMNPWCQLCESLVRVADADTACREILQVFDRLQEDEGSWIAEVSIATAKCFLLGYYPSWQLLSAWVVASAHFTYLKMPAQL